ncbi:nuclear transport factor 2 family protein [Candidatus Bipolaricaulota bacterium]|nr:nuclear transport factor 2 family protein [Candidatus Bipolaricaulota bacterium]
MPRTMEEILDHHNRAVLSNDYAEMIADYADDAVLITLKGTYVGKEAIGRALQQLAQAMPNMRGVESPTNAMIVEGDTLLLRWSAESDTGTITDAVDTIVLKGDKIWRQTTSFEIVPK